LSNFAEIILFLQSRIAEEKRVVLVTITAVIGSSSRSEGTHMAVCEDGRWVGSLSGGCTEAAVVGEALRVLKSGKAEQLRFGSGSPFIDIKLPCGGAIELLMLPDPDAVQIAAARTHLEKRMPVLLNMALDGSLAVNEAVAGQTTGWSEGRFWVRHDPAMRLLVIGHGEEVPALATLAHTYGATVEIFTPDKTHIEKTSHLAIKGHWLKTPDRSPALQSDRWSAVIFLFHDHDWELQLMQQALEQDSFFIGAMGSPKTHASRLAALTAAGIGQDQCARIKGPIGLIPSTRDPQTLALSVLAQLVEEYRRKISAQD
jgi:xanthine dehydrogenase accessory factor